MKKKTYKTFKEIVAAVPQPKILTDNTELPYVFDLLWDCKTGKDLKIWKLMNNPDVKRTLREHGFDVKD